MKITESRNKREGRFAGHYCGIVFRTRRPKLIQWCPGAFAVEYEAWNRPSNQKIVVELP